MELHRSSPPAYLAHHPADLNSPAVPQTAISRPQVHAELTLPDLKTVLSPEFEDLSNLARLHTRTSIGSPVSAASLPPIEQPRSHGTRSSMESAVVSPSEAGSAMSLDERVGRSTSTLSIDDPDVRIAAEALSGLGNLGFARSPSSRTLSGTSPSTAGATQEDPEPLLRLFTKSHPWVGGTIQGSINAYSTTKFYSPRLVQMGAELVETNVGSPMLNTVSSVGRMTGIESGLRWYYGGTRSRPAGSETDAEESASKRRRLDEADLESGALSSTSDYRRESEESALEPLPAYQASGPPSYREEASPVRSDRATQNQSWSSQVFVMTSGLGVALSQTSRSSLRLCLSLLSNSAERVSTLMDALKMVLEQYDQASEAWHSESTVEKGERSRTPEHDESARRLAEQLKKHSDDIWHTMRNCVNSISNAAGGALPDNARQFVRNQLMSLPQRWRLVSDTNQTGDSETSRSAHRMIGFAVEGLDMMSQVSQTIRLTLSSAEEWLTYAGRRRELADTPMISSEKDADASAK